MTLNPTTAQDPSDTSIKSDVLIVGAGPAGLFQVFELGLLGLKAQVIDSLPHPGGQCVELYADKAIYDIPGLAKCTGQELTDRLMLQIQPFEARFHLNDMVQSIALLEGRQGFEVQSAEGLKFEVKAVVLANGVGAFLPRPLNVPEHSQYVGRQVFHGDLSQALKKLQAQKLQPLQSLQTSQNSSTRKKIWIVGGDEEAVNNALWAYQNHPDLDVTLIHRRTHLDVSDELSQALSHALQDSQSLETTPRGSDKEGHSTLQFKHGQIVHLLEHLEHAKDLSSTPRSKEQEDQELSTGGRTLKALQWVDENAQMHVAEVDLVMVNLGLTPQLGPVADWGPVMLKKQITVNTEDFSTSVPGIFAIGDVITYPGKKKLILSGFHEAALASFGIAKWVLQQDRIPFEYTSASALLQSRLGVRNE